MSTLVYSILGIAGGLLFLFLTATVLFNLLEQIRDYLKDIYALLKDKN